MSVNRDRGGFERIETPTDHGTVIVRHVWRNGTTPVLVLPNVTGMTLAQAALAYARAGWYVLPTDPGDIKNPGSVVGGRWQAKSSRDPDQIAAWWTENPHYGIALHVGRSGAVGFDLDCFWLVVIEEAGRAEIADALRGAGAINGTRTEGDRGHYLFACKPNEYSNSAGAFGRWGEVRGANGVIIAAPTPHPDADKGGCYRQIRTGPLSPLPDVLRAVLSEVADSAEPLTNAELEQFLDAHPGTGCGHADCRHSPKGAVTKFAAKVAEGHSRYVTMCHDVLPWVFREAIAGCYSAREAFDTLADVFAEAKPEATPREFYRAAEWAAAQAQADPQADQVHADKADDDDMPRLWRATELHPSAPPSWLAKGRLPRAAISLLVGDEGIGKSLLWVWIVGAVTTGKPLPEFGIPAREPARVIIGAVTEDDWSSTVRPRLEAVHADLTRVSVVCIEPDGSGAPTFPRDLHLIASADPPPALVVVDAWLDTVPSGLKVRDPQDARRALHPWKEIATTTGAAVLLITHTNRDHSTDARDRYGITGELRKKARMTLYAQSETEGRMIVGPEKMNTGRPLPASEFVIEAVQHFDPTEDDDGTIAVLRYLGDSDRTAREHVRDSNTKGADAEEDGDPKELWLYEHLTLAGLAGGEVTPTSAAKAAKDEKDISRRTVFRQFAALKAAGLAESIDRGTFPRTTFWQIIGAPDPDGTAGSDGTPA